MDSTTFLSVLLLGTLMNSGETATSRTGKQPTTSHASKSESASKPVRAQQNNSPKNSGKPTRESKTSTNPAATGSAVSDYDSKSALEGIEVERIKGLEKESIQADLKKDKTWLEDHLADDLTSANAEGAIETKAQLLSRCLDSNNTLASKTYDEISVRPYGEDVIIATGKLSQKGRSNNVDYTVQRTFMHVWVNRLGHWRQVALQESPLVSTRDSKQPATPPVSQSQKVAAPSPSPARTQ